MSDIDTLTIGEARTAVQRGKEIEKLLGGQAATTTETAAPAFSPMIGKYVIVRCRDAGVHSGYLQSTNGRECILKNSRRLWRWRVPKGKSDFLSGVALYGIADDCKVGEAVGLIHLTENCEIIEATDAARSSIEGFEVCTRTN